MIGKKIYDLAKMLWPINRSITGEGVRSTLNKISSYLPDLKIEEISSGENVFDWTIPKEWKVNNAYIKTPNGKKICCFADNNLHLLGYSVPIHKTVNLDELQKNLHSLPNQPTAIPYVTSYYQERWGFCISDQERKNLVEGEYEVFIDTELFDGVLNYGELFIKGKLDQEILLSTYVCHPSMANNELSGPCVTTFLAKWLSENNLNRYSYRIVFIPETIGSIAFLSRKKDVLKSKVVAGFNISCIGDNRDYSYLPSRNGSTLSDSIAQHVLLHIHPSYKSYSWSDRGSDERQYCAPGIDLPIASIMRTKYGQYDEYHTSLDDLVNVVSPEGLDGGYMALKAAIKALENNIYPKVNVFGEPQLGKRGLYPTLSKTNAINDETSLMLDLLTWSDGTKSLLEIAELCDVPIWDFYQIVETLKQNDLLTVFDHPSQT
jgi:aminopeptidase-like protein